MKSLRSPQLFNQAQPFLIHSAAAAEFPCCCSRSSSHFFCCSRTYQVIHSKLNPTSSPVPVSGGAELSIVVDTHRHPYFPRSESACHPHWAEHPSGLIIGVTHPFASPGLPPTLIPPAPRTAWHTPKRGQLPLSGSPLTPNLADFEDFMGFVCLSQQSWGSHADEMAGKSYIM